MVARATEEAERQQTVTACTRVERITHLVHQLLTLARLEPEAAQQPQDTGGAESSPAHDHR